MLIKGNTQILFGGMGRLSENCVLNIKNKSHSVTAEIVVPRVGRRGRHRRPGRRTSAAGASTRRAASSSTATTSAACSTSTSKPASPMPAGEHQVRMEFAYAGGGLGKGGKVTLYSDGKKVGEGRHPHDAGDGVLRRRRLRRRRGHRRAGLAGLRPARQRSSTGTSKACSSPSPTRPRTPITWSRRRKPSASRWRGSSVAVVRRSGASGALRRRACPAKSESDHFRRQASVPAARRKVRSRPDLTRSPSRRRMPASCALRSPRVPLRLIAIRSSRCSAGTLIDARFGVLNGRFRRSRRSAPVSLHVAGVCVSRIGALGSSKAMPTTLQSCTRPARQTRSHRM